MVGNGSLSLRELFTTVLDSHPAGWTTSFMSGLPANVESIAGAYDLVVYELGKAESAERLAVASRLRRSGIDVLTHVEGQAADRMRDDLLRDGVFVVANPLDGEHIGEALDRIASHKKAGALTTGARTRIRRFFGR